MNFALILQALMEALSAAPVVIGDIQGAVNGWNASHNDAGKAQAAATALSQLATHAGQAASAMLSQPPTGATTGG